MSQKHTAQYTAFAGSRRLATGALSEVAVAAKHALEGGEQAPVLIFDDAARVVDVDFRGSDADVAARFTDTTPGGDGARPGDGSGADDGTDDGDTSPYRESLTPRARGRPRLGVIAREVTLLPRHWEWLAAQPGGASAAVRRLVDEARRTHAARDQRRRASESAYRFMSAMAGNEPGFEEATRALFAGDAARFTELTARWPRDVRDHVRALAADAFAAGAA